MKSNLIEVREVRTGIEQAVKIAGGQHKLAAELGVTQQAVSTWERQGWAPLRRAQEIEALYGVPRASLINPRIADLMDLPSGEGDEE